MTTITQSPTPVPSPIPTLVPSFIPTPSPSPSPTTLPSSIYEACVADTIQTARESGTEPDISWCDRWNKDDDGPIMPTPRPLTQSPTLTQRALSNSTLRTRAPLQTVRTTVIPPKTPLSQTTMRPNYATIMPRTTTQPISVLMRSTISQILSRPPVYVAPTRSPAPIITVPGTMPLSGTRPPSTNPALVPIYPAVVAFVHEDTWMRQGNMKILTLRNDTLTLEKLVPKDPSQIFVIDAAGKVRVLEGNGAYVQVDAINEWQFISRQLKGSFSMETREKKRLVFRTETGSVSGAVNETGPSSGWFIIPLGRLS